MERFKDTNLVHTTFNTQNRTSSMKDDAKKQQERSSWRKHHRRAVLLLIYLKRQEKLITEQSHQPKIQWKKLRKTKAISTPLKLTKNELKFFYSQKRIHQAFLAQFGHPIYVKLKRAPWADLIAFNCHINFWKEILTAGVPGSEIQCLKHNSFKHLITMLKGIILQSKEEKHEGCSGTVLLDKSYTWQS